jgi:hypothetical protein
VNNRQIGAQERILARSLADQAKETGLKKPDGSVYTQADIENAMRNSGRGAEPVTKGMQVDSKNPITDKGAAFTAGSDGKTLVQVNQDGSNLNPNTIDLKLAAYIVERTGGANTPYRDLYNRVEAAKSGPPTNPNAGLNTIMPAANGAVTAEAAAGLLPAPSERRSVDQIDRDLKTGVCKSLAGNLINTVLPGSVVMRPIYDGTGKVLSWVIEQGFNRATSQATGSVVCGN